MSSAKINESTRTLLYCLSVFCIVAIALWFGASSNTASAGSNNGADTAAAPQATFPGTGVGAIPDGNAGTPPQFGSPLVINFAVSGVSGPVTSVTADITLTHTWVGDVDMVLRAPGGTPSLVLVSRIGVQTATSFGSASDYSGTYAFSDAATGANIWTAAASNPVPQGTYRTTAPGGAGQTNPPPVTSLNTTFGGLTPAQANGTWTLSIRDAASADTGTVTAANLTVNPTSVAPTTDAPVDFNGDGKTDYAVVRNIGGGPNGQIRWFYNLNGSANPTVALDWGLASDFFVPEDFDGDGKDDIAVWRPGAATQAAFYILNSATNTARVEAFGQTGDDPTVVGDYGGDEKADLAVYRPGAVAGQQSTWFYRTTPGGAVTYVNWGQFGDFEAPGDYNGDGKFDFAIQRDSGGQGQFWILNSAGGTSTTIFGLSSDVVVPGDWDGDGKTDIATARAAGGAIQWQYLSSMNNSINYYTFGNATGDFIVQGQYDGDNKTDPAVWDQATGQFQSYNTTNGGATFFQLGSNGDYPPANYNQH